MSGKWRGVFLLEGNSSLIFLEREKDDDMETLFDKTRLNKVELRNRFIRSATWENMADRKGRLTESLWQTYQELARGGVGLIITGFVFVMQNEQPNFGMLGIYNDSFIPEYEALTNMVHSFGSAIIPQIVYGGSQTSFNVGSREIWGPSAVEEINSAVTPKAMTKNDIRSLIKAFGDAAERAQKAGFDGVEIHAAHGYLLSQFLTPYYNRRTDEYGGLIHNRARIIYEVYEEIRRRVGGDYLVMIKINGEDFSEGGLILEESMAVCQELAVRGIDAIEVSGGQAPKAGKKNIIIRTDIKLEAQESYFAREGAMIADAVDVPVALVGGNRTLKVMGNILQSTDIKYFSLSRPFLCEPGLAARWRKGDKSRTKCISCNHCLANAVKGEQLACVLREEN